MSRCLLCGKETVQALKEWNYYIYNVKSFHCLTLDETFNAYYRDGQLSHLIVDSVARRASRIMRYLRNHNEATVDEISNALNIEAGDVLTALLKWEKRGIADRIAKAQEQK